MFLMWQLTFWKESTTRFLCYTTYQVKVMCVTEGLQDYNRFWNECKVLKKRRKRERGQKVDFSRQNGEEVTVDKKQKGSPEWAVFTLYIWLPHKVTRGLCNILPTSIKDEGWTWKFFIPISFKLTLLVLFQLFPSNPVLGSRMSNLSRRIFFWSFACSSDCAPPTHQSVSLC